MTFLVTLFLSSSVFAGTNDLPYKDGDFACISQKEADRYMSDFQVDVQSFGGLDLCNAAKDTKKLLNDFTLIEKAEFAPDSNHSMIPNIIPVNNYYSWMKSQTRGVERGNDVPFATAYNSGGYFTMQDGWAALSTLGRVGTVLHEARHTAGYPHYACSHGPYGASSTSGCDTSYAQKGAHAVEMEYYTRVVLDSKNLHPVYKSMARLMALGRSNFVFNESPIRKREALLALAGNRMVLVDGDKVLERETPPVAAGSVLKRTSFGASLVKNQKAIAVDVYQFASNGALMEDDFSYYKLYKTPRPNGPQEVKDLEEIDIGNLRYFTVLGEQGKVYSYDFPNGAWHPASSASSAGTFVTRAPSGEAGLFAVKADGSVLPFNLSNRTFGAALRDRWTTDTKAYAQYGSFLVKLTSDGKVVGAGNGTPVDAFVGKNVTDLVNIPLYDAYEVAQ